jgi:excisionase family DNA binding protein
VSGEDAGMTVREVASRFRVGRDKVRHWIKSGQLRAINTASRKCQKPRYIVLREYLAEFEATRLVAVPSKPPRYRRKAALVDYYPD